MLFFIEQIIDLYAVFMLHVLVALVIAIGVSVWSWRVLHKPVLLLVFWGIIVIFLSGGFFRLVQLEAERNRRWQDSLSGLTMAFAIATENMGHAKITLETTEDDDIYQKIHNTFFDWEMHYPLIASVYTIRKIDGKTPLIVRPAADINGNWVIDKDDPLEAAVPLGTNYDDYNSAYDAVLDGSLLIYVSEKPVRDKWGEHITAVAPLHDSQGKIEALLGIDFYPNRLAAFHNDSRSAPVSIVLLGLIVIILAFVAITLLFDMLRSLNDVKKSIEAALLVKTDFLANMSHEIRTPMNAILGLLDFLFVPDSTLKEPDDWPESAQLVRKNALHLLEVIDNILEISVAETDRVIVQWKPVSPAEVLREIQRIFRSQVMNKELEFHMEIVSEVPSLILSDKRLLMQILINLVKNAVKYTERGSIIIKCFIGDLSADRIAPPLKTDDNSCKKHEYFNLVIEVSDTGIGISKELQPRLFEPFMQSDTSMTREFGGTGLGLALAKRQADRLQGTLGVRSELGKGSTFTLTLTTRAPDENEHFESTIIVSGSKMPDKTRKDALESSPKHEVQKGRVPVTPTSAKPIKRERLSGLRILLVEDVVINQMVVTALLRDEGAQIDIVGNGQLALDRIRLEEAENRFYDIVLMDMQMPVMDGYEATRTLRNEGYTRPIIALTAHALTSDREKTLECGCDEYATKPVNKEILIDLIRCFISGKCQIDGLEIASTGN